MTQPTHKTENMIVDMQPVGRRIDVEPGTTLLEAAQESGVGLVSLCGGEGWCESCLVRITNGEANPPTQSELDYLGAEGLEAGHTVESGQKVEPTIGNAMPLASIPTGMSDHNIELTAAQGGKLVRPAGGASPTHHFTKFSRIGRSTPSFIGYK